MQIYTMNADANRYKNVVPEEANVWERIFIKFDGRRIDCSSWSPVKVKILQGKGNGDLLSSDFPSFASHVPVFSKRAVESLSDILTENGQILPLICDEGDYFAFNITSVIDALDELNSDIIYFKSSGRIMNIIHYEFLSEKLTNAQVFKLSCIPLMEVFVTEAFVNRVVSNNLKGFVFNLVWESD